MTGGFGQQSGECIPYDEFDACTLSADSGYDLRHGYVLLGMGLLEAVLTDMAVFGSGTAKKSHEKS